MTVTSLLAACVAMNVLMIGLLIKIVWDVKKEAREAKLCVQSKVSKDDCRYEMDKLEGRVS
jgi:hypothetical protein